ncbi:MAG: hypothetical protein GQ563_02170 [Desulfuromusa sp.]|nr:hypothetical protein [Desulfuromusa sp.]
MKWKVLLTILCICLMSTAAFGDGKPNQSNRVEPVQFLVYFSIPDGSLVDNNLTSYQVPVGKRLVIEFISVKVGSVSVGDSVDVYVTTTLGSSSTYHYLGVAEPVVRDEVDPSAYPDRFISKLVKLYADPETWVGGWANRVSRTGAGESVTEVWVTFSGYLVNAQ